MFIKQKIPSIKGDFINHYGKIILSLLFMLIVFFWAYITYNELPNNTFLLLGSILGAYMAMNIGANDVANNVGPAVGSKALSLMGAIIIAAIFESLGAFVAGGDVVKTIKKGIIDPNAFENVNIFIWAMSAALVSGALWLNFATSIGAPVSTTHAIVGGVIGSGVAAAGFDVISWNTVGKIILSWVISPIMGGIVAAMFLYFIKKNIIKKKDKLKAAVLYVPYLFSVMVWVFLTYLILKGFKKIFLVSFGEAVMLSLVIACISFFVIKKIINKLSANMTNTRPSINSLFVLPLIFAAALLSFAHGANDVANAIGPLAAIADAVINVGISSKVSIPIWIMAIGAFGIVIGLGLYGPKLIKTVGSEITELDQVRAFSIAMASAVTVIVASQLGLPVSSTHIAIGGVFGVGFLREYLDFSEKNYFKEVRGILKNHKNIIKESDKKRKKLTSKEIKDKEDYVKITKLYKKIDKQKKIIQNFKMDLKKYKKTSYVKRNIIGKIIAAWVITVPASAFLSAFIFFIIKGIMI